MTGELSVTVGIPTYDNADTIETTLRQLVEGTRPPDRIIVVDASTDATPEIVERVAAETDVRIDCYRQSDRGRGVGAARQDIYKRFDGDLLACLDTEFTVDDDWLEQHVEFHRDHPEYDVLSAADNRGVDGPITDPKVSHFFQQKNCSLKREILERVGGWDPWFPRGEDWDMQIRLYRAGAKAYAKSSLEATPMHDGSPFVAFQKTRGRPSSVAFLRKYGLWYARYHPEHVLGDVASVGATGLLLFVLPLVVALPPVGLLALLFAVAPVVPYLYLKYIRHRDDGFRREDVILAARFYLLGWTAVRELLRERDHDWNMGGVEER